MHSCFCSLYYYFFLLRFLSTSLVIDFIITIILGSKQALLRLFFVQYIPHWCEHIFFTQILYVQSFLWLSPWIICIVFKIISSFFKIIKTKASIVIAWMISRFMLMKWLKTYLLTWSIWPYWFIFFAIDTSDRPPHIMSQFYWFLLSEKTRAPVSNFK